MSTNTKSSGEQDGNEYFQFALHRVVKDLVGISKSYTFENKKLKVEVGRFFVRKTANP